ncbi:MAG: sensor histidine kinase [Actinomycetales bacterium]|nr:sensor histidine kinase [Actinomycetales bacterium]
MTNARTDAARRAVRLAADATWRALAAAAAEPDQHPRPRRRAARFATWLTIPLGLFFMLVVIDEHAWIRPNASALLVLTGTASAVAVALLGKRALLGWRIVTVATAVWLTPGMNVLGPFAWPMSQMFVVVPAFLLATFRYRRTVAWGVWGWTALLLVLGGFLAGSPSSGAGWALSLLAVTAVVDATRVRRRAQAEVSAEREARVRQEEHSLVLEERARIARDLHDVVAHHMSMIAVQAESAPYRIAGLDDAARAELASIADSARAALSDVRGILTVLRDGEAAPERAPQPALDDLETLIGAARAAGASVSLQVTGSRRALATTVEIGAYRIIQESLANAARHAPGAAVVVGLAFGDHHLEVTVTNDAPAAGEGADDDGRPGADGLEEAGQTGGHGLVGMRERAALLGGEVEAGPTADGGFEVRATLPVEVGE